MNEVQGNKYFKTYIKDVVALQHTLLVYIVMKNVNYLLNFS